VLRRGRDHGYQSRSMRIQCARETAQGRNFFPDFPCFPAHFFPKDSTAPYPAWPPAVRACGGEWGIDTDVMCFITNSR
jgi:hypothetical protein